jgi:hypothetical protein
MPRLASCTSLTLPSGRRVTAPFLVAMVWLPAGAMWPVAVLFAAIPPGLFPAVPPGLFSPPAVVG